MIRSQLRIGRHPDGVQAALVRRPGCLHPPGEGTGPATRSSSDWYSAARLPLAHIGMFRSAPTLRTTW